MKTIKLFALVLILFTGLCDTVAQNDKREVTKFMGIPVDGTKASMIQQLKAKGFKQNVAQDCLEGEFNGKKVMVSVVTNNNKVYRITLLDIVGSNENTIKNRFNYLCKQFESNGKYLSDPENHYLDDAEDISYEITVHKKQYEAAYYQMPETKIDSTELMEVLQTKIYEKYTQEYLDTASVEEMLDISSEILGDYIYEKVAKRCVWFTIVKVGLEYKILMFYDNLYNQANGEDL